jgi:large subunit ribosomal protein L18
MRVTIKRKWSDKLKLRMKKRLKIRKRVSGDEMRPRLCVYKSTKNIYAQMIDDSNGKTLVSASTLQDKVSGTGKAAAGEIGKLIAQRAKEKNITKAVFDRSGYLYHGRVKSLADGAREAGLQF